MPSAVSTHVMQTQIAIKLHSNTNLNSDSCVLIYKYV
jgi:hypothetical protein